MEKEENIEANIGCKVRIYPTEKQKKLIYQNIHTSRKGYNFAVQESLTQYKNWKSAKDEKVQQLKEQNLTDEQINKEMESFNKQNKKDYVNLKGLYKKFTEECKKEGSTTAWCLECDSSARGTTFQKFDKAYSKFQKEMKNGTSQKRVEERMKKDKENHVERTYTYPYDYGHPQFKKYSKAKSYITTVSLDKLDSENHRLFLPKIGWVLISQNQEFPDLSMYSEGYVNGKKFNVTISTNGLEFYASFGYYTDFISFDTPKTDIIGVDLGCKSLAVLSNGMVIPNLSKDEKIKEYTNKINMLKRELSKLYNGKSATYKPYTLTKEQLEKIPAKERGAKLAELSKQKYQLPKTQKVRKLETAIKRLQIAIAHRKNYLLHYYCEQIVRLNPAGIIFERLNINAMKKSKMSKSVHDAAMGAFRLCLVWHATKHNIPVKYASRIFASTQLCSKCHNKNMEMKGIANLNKRTFVCPTCGYIVDRDLNASINLKQLWNSKDAFDDYNDIKDISSKE